MPMTQSVTAGFAGAQLKLGWTTTVRKNLEQDQKGFFFSEIKAVNSSSDLLGSSPLIQKGPKNAKNRCKMKITTCIRDTNEAYLFAAKTDDKG